MPRPPKKSAGKKPTPRKKGPFASEEFASSSNYFKGVDIRKPFEATIAELKKEKFDDGDKWVVHLEDQDKSIVLNKLNGAALAEDLGDQMNNWVGRRIRIDTERRRNPQTGRMVPAIAVCGVLEEVDNGVDDLDVEDDSELE